MLHGLYLSFKTRHVDSRFESSGKVMLAIYQYALSFVVFALVESIATLSEWESNIVFCAAMTFSALSSMALIVLTKVMMLHDDMDSQPRLPVVAISTGSRASARVTKSHPSSAEAQAMNPTGAAEGPKLTHRQFMDIVFSPADIIDMNER